MYHCKKQREKQLIIRAMQKELDKKSKDWKNFKWNNAQLLDIKRSSIDTYLQTIREVGLLDHR